MNVLVIAAHPDDEVLGCGGTIARHVTDGDVVNILIIADGVTSRRMLPVEAETLAHERTVACKKACQFLGTKPPIFLRFKDQMLDATPILDIIQRIEDEISIVKPEIVYTHHGYDLNQDHCIVNQAVMIALRPTVFSHCAEIYGFEIPSSTELGHGFEPNYFVEIDIAAKIKALSFYHMEMIPHPHPRSYKGVENLAAYRGATCGRHSAEAFMVQRIIR